MNYNYLKTNSPNIIVEAIKYIGIKEILGKQHNPIIMQWAKELGLQNVYTSDENEPIKKLL